MAKVATSHGKYKGVIVSKTDMRKLKAGLQAKMKDIVALLVKQLSFIGEECIRIARESGSYNDITGNLRSSIGYVVLVDGKPVVTGASKQYSGKDGNGEAGPPAAPKSASEISVGCGSDRLRRHEIRRVCRSSPPQGCSHLRRVESRIACQEITQRSNRIAR